MGSYFGRGALERVGLCEVDERRGAESSSGIPLMFGTANQGSCRGALHRAACDCGERIPARGRMPKPLTQRASISYVADFVRTLLAGLNVTESPDISKAAWWISWPQKGTILFSAEDLAQFNKVIEQLQVDFVKQDDLTRRSLETMLKDTILKAWDPLGECRVPFDERSQAAVADLKARLSAEPVEYLMFVSVDGFKPEDLPLTFGGMRFAVFGPGHVRSLRARTRKRPKFWGDLKQTRLWGEPCAAVRVKARDFATARRRANTATREAMDCLNFVGSLHPYNHAWLRFPGEASSAAVVTPGAPRNGHASASYDTTGPIGPFALGQLRETPKTERLMRKLSSLLAKALARERRSRGGGRSTVSETLLAAVERAGRASIEREREQQFLLQAISLETAVLPVQGSELTYRLAVRVARLLANKPERRAWIQETVVRLYKVRSAIVHSGSYEVADEDLRLLKEIAARTLLTLLGRERLLADKPEALDAMFKRVELGR